MRRGLSIQSVQYCCNLTYMAYPTNHTSLEINRFRTIGKGCMITVHIHYTALLMHSDDFQKELHFCLTVNPERFYNIP